MPPRTLLVFLLSLLGWVTFHFLSFLILITPAWAKDVPLEGFVGYPGIHQKGQALKWDGDSATQVTFSPLEAILRTPDKDYVLSLSSLPPETVQLLKSEDGSKKKVSLVVPETAILRTKDFPGSVRTDCGEMPLSYDEVRSLAEDPKIKSQLDFLNALPKGTLQTFTFNF